MKKKLLCIMICALCVIFSSAVSAVSDEKKAELYQHDIDMTVLSDYIYGGSKATDGEAISFGYAEVPNEWTRHKRPEDLPLVGKAVIHIGHEGKEGGVWASFYPGTPPINYHSKRLDELIEIGYFPIGSEYSRVEGNANRAFIAFNTSEFDVVAYNDQWVAVWSTGGVDASRGIGAPCGGTKYIPYGSYKPGVYFFPRKNCYILDINNQLAEPPEIKALGTATCTLIVKTSPDATDYVEAGIYKPNQSFQIVDATPVNGHYKVYYKHGIYYVNSDYVNIKLNNIKKPIITYTALFNPGDLKSVDIKSAAAQNAEVVGKAKSGATANIVELDYNDDFAKLWFNSKECFIEKKYLTNYQKTASGSGIAKLGTPIGVMVIDTPWKAYGQLALSPEAFEVYKEYNYGTSFGDGNMMAKLLSIEGGLSKMEENDWANVYKIEDFKYAPDPEFPREVEKCKLYTILFDGNVRYVIQNVDQYCTFNFYPGNGYNKSTVAKTQSIYVDLDKYDVLAYNIDGNNYFKIRDIAKMLSGTVKTFDISYDASTNSIDMLSYFDYTEVGGELTRGDGVTRTAYSSSAFLTYDGIPIRANCYNIDGNNYFKLRDVTDALDCRVVWDGDNQLIKINTGMPAYDDPDEAVG
mgnify:FL=1